MNYLQEYLNFDTIEQGEIFLSKARTIRDSMGGALYWGIADDDCNEISQKLIRLKIEKFSINKKLSSIDFRLVELYVRKMKLLTLDKKLNDLENDLIAFYLSSKKFENIKDINIKDIEEFINNKKLEKLNNNKK